MATIAEQRKEIERQMNGAGINGQFSAVSETNGLSIYYTVDGVKYRFSNHSVSNRNRMEDEKHFPLPFVSTLGFGGVITNITNNLF